MKSYKIKILGHTYDLILDERLNQKEGSVGLFSANTNEIKIDSTFLQSRQEEGLLHEIFESMRYHLNMTDALSHQNLSALSEVLYQVMKDNPHIFSMRMPG